MAAWQACVHVVLPSGELPSDYARRLARVLPVGRHWRSGGERWGVEDGDMIDVSAEPPAEVWVRFDLRHWRPDLYERFVAFVHDIGGGLRDAETDADVAVTATALMDWLRDSRAARFVRDPRAYLSALRTDPIDKPDQP